MPAESHDDRITGGEEVVDSVGQKVGTVAYIVVRPPELHMTDIVVSTGPLLGRDIVVSTSEIGGMSDGRVHLTVDKDGLEEHKDYVEIHYEGPPENWAPEGGFLYPTQSVLWPAGSYYPQPTSTTINAPEGTVGLREGMDVVSSDGHKIGAIHAVDADPDTGDLRDIIVRHGFISKHEVRIPCDRVAEIVGDAVKLTITRAEVEVL
ncbi:MAG: hypothetical protein PVSMB7_18830 [Chloroflexota bacterium]